MINRFTITDTYNCQIQYIGIVKMIKIYAYPTRIVTIISSAFPIKYQYSLSRIYSLYTFIDREEMK